MREVENDLICGAPTQAPISWLVACGLVQCNEKKGETGQMRQEINQKRKIMKEKADSGLHRPYRQMQTHVIHIFPGRRVGKLLVVTAAVVMLMSAFYIASQLAKLNHQDPLLLSHPNEAAGLQELSHQPQEQKRLQNQPLQNHQPQQPAHRLGNPLRRAYTVVEFASSTAPLAAVLPVPAPWILFPESASTLPSLNAAAFADIIKRLSALDTGRFLQLPGAHFDSRNQPIPSPSFNVSDITEQALADVKYFHECVLDTKRDARFGPPWLCVKSPTVLAAEQAADATKEKNGYAKVKKNSNTPKWEHDFVQVHESLSGILHSFSSFAESHVDEGIVWWISHGEMLGWFWGAKLLPWDVDLDVQMSLSGLLALARYNQTIIDGRFLIDIAPNAVVRSPQKENVIDGRIVDIKTGYFMDITGLSRSSASGNVACKSPHYLKLEEVLPLHETVLEGVKVWRPHSAILLLKREYGAKSMIKTVYDTREHGIFSFNNGVWEKTSK
ncbi:hypothetical protein HK100_002509 [Physocladia obscura]|uniref:LicD/FKTN/FKRP nucleotidyltransferase domain-containing protein n=1 Tax=Physocladia obscura TaxID=109957 RepID=A0AAD5XE64_9FUNG|nr:hypothetical protein HK100_002509 [Physocladia obscura]